MPSKTTLAQEYVSVLDSLISDMRANGNGEQRIPLSGGKRIRQTGGAWTYTFVVRWDKPIADNAETKLDIFGTRYSCELISASESHLQLILDADHGPELPKSVLCVEEMGLLSQLRDRLSGIPNGEPRFFNSELADATFRNGKLAIPQWTPHSLAVKGLNDDQERQSKQHFRIAFCSSGDRQERVKLPL